MVQIQIWVLYSFAFILITLQSLQVYVTARRMARIRRDANAVGRLFGAWEAGADFLQKLKVSIDSGCDVDEIRESLNKGEIPHRAFTSNQTDTH